MDAKDYSKKIGKLRSDFQKSLNDIYIWCSVVVDALLQVSLDEEFLNHKDFIVPSSKSDLKTVERGPKRVQSIINNALNYELYYSVLVYIVAQVEAFLNDVIRITLQFDNRRLLTQVQGIDTGKKVEVSEILSSDTKEILIDTIINRQLTSLFYASPSKQFEYIKKVLGVDIDTAIQSEWVELKATRDLIVHNYGTINDVYIKKCNVFARGNIGEKIVVDKIYFENAIAKMKSLIGKITSTLQRSIKEEVSSEIVG